MYVVKLLVTSHVRVLVLVYTAVYLDGCETKLSGIIFVRRGFRLEVYEPKFVFGSFPLTLALNFF